MVQNIIKELQVMFQTSDSEHKVAVAKIESLKILFVIP